MVSPEFQRLHCSGNASVAGQHNYCDGGINLLNVLNQIESAEIGHLQIKQNKVRTDARRELQAFCLRVGLMGLAATVAKRAAEPVSKYLIVVYNDDSQTIGCYWFMNRHFSYWAVAESHSTQDLAPTRMTTRHRGFVRTDRPGMRRVPFPDLLVSS